jgi:hypothetical protein
MLIKIETVITLMRSGFPQNERRICPYYQKKIAEGKHVLKALNAIRNKLVLRIAAVIKNQKPYDENYSINKF